MMRLLPTVVRLLALLVVAAGLAVPPRPVAAAVMQDAAPRPAVARQVSPSVAGPAAPPPEARNAAGEYLGWQALTTGVAGSDGSVFAMAVLSGSVYVGGQFNHAGGVLAPNIARWIPAEQRWEALDTGVNGTVYSLTVSRGELYVGGSFTQAGPTGANNIARWNPATHQWKALGGGITSNRIRINALSVNAMATISDVVYVGGAFTHADGAPTNPLALPVQNIARWNPETEEWDTVGTGITAGGTRVFALPVTAMAVAGDYVYVGGSFSAAGGLPAANIARFRVTDDVWDNLGAGIASGDNTPGVFALHVSGNDLWAGGSFSQVQNFDEDPYIAPSIARFGLSTSKWLPITTTLTGTVNALTTNDGQLVAAGLVSQAGGSPVRNIASLDPSTRTWQPLGAGIDGVSVNALLTVGGEVFTGGTFTGAGGNRADNIARWNPVAKNWLPVGLGIGDGDVNAILVAGTDVFIGGEFGSAGGVPARNIARWNTVSQTWSGLGSGIEGPYARILALAVIGNEIFAGGIFTSAGGVAVQNIAAWNKTGSTWAPLGNGIAGSLFTPSVNALAAQGTDLIVGGAFGQAGTLAANNVAAYSTTTHDWFTLGDGVRSGQPDAPAYVSALAVQGTTIYVGGFFLTAGGVPTRNIARYSRDTTFWSGLAGGTGEGKVNAIALLQNDVYVGGNFGTAGGTTALNVARWNTGTTAWSALGGGVPDGSIHGMTVISNEVYFGGNFSQVGDVGALNVARWNPQTGTWSRVDGGLTGAGQFVFAVASDTSTLFAGGSFNYGGTTVLNSIGQFSVDPPDVRLRVYFPSTMKSAKS